MLFYKVERKNTASIALIEKLGGKLHSTNYFHEQILSAIYSMSNEELDPFKSSNFSAFVKSLEKYGEEILENELPTDILIYKIERKEM